MHTLHVDSVNGTLYWVNMYVYDCYSDSTKTVRVDIYNFQLVTYILGLRPYEGSANFTVYSLQMGTWNEQIWEPLV